MAPVRRTTKGVSLSRGPALALGTFLVIAGLYFLYMEHGFPRLSQFPNGTAHTDGKAFFGLFGLNGWSGELTAAAGALLLIGAAEHHLAKTASFIVAIVFAGVGIWALVNHHSALGLFAANIWTILLWFAAAAYLLINTALPRPGGTVVDDSANTPVRTPVAQPAVADRRSTVVPAHTPAAEPTTVGSAPTTTSTEPTTVVNPVAGTDSQSGTGADGTMRRPATQV